VPAEVELGLHLCYGDPGHKHVVEPKDTMGSKRELNLKYQESSSKHLERKRRRKISLYLRLLSKFPREASEKKGK
jgi:hypothetical protein